MLDTTIASIAGTTAERVAQARGEHDAAIQRRDAARADARAARRAADEARAAVKALLDGAAASGSTIDQHQHEKLHMAAERAGRAATAAQAIAAGADRLHEQATIAVYHARAADHLDRVKVAAAREVDAAQAVDDAMALLRRRIADFELRVREGAEAVEQANAFDAEIPAALKHNLVASTRHASELPRVRISDRIAHVTVTTSLIWKDTSGRTFEVMNDLAAWRRAGWDGLAGPGPHPVGPALKEIRGRVM